MSQVKLYNNPLIIRNVEFKEYVTEKEALKKVDEFRFSDAGQTLSDSKKNSIRRIANYLATHPNFDEVSDDHVLIKEGYPIIFTSNNYKKLKYEKPVKKAEGMDESSNEHNQLLDGDITSAMIRGMDTVNDNNIFKDGFEQNKSEMKDDNSSLKKKRFVSNQSDGVNKNKKNKSTKVKKWQREIRTQQRSLDRQIRDFEEVEKKTTNLLKQNGKKKDLTACKLFAKELVRSRRQKTRLYTTTLKLSGSLKKSTEIMKMVNGLSRLPELSKGLLGEASVVNVPLENPGLEEEEEPAAALDEMQARLHALKS
ncbi:3104_t:CDS:2 [Funneliformis geosporum]|uniref:3104_t:CDS:1 n=1 Tax=Funneliformis geosporum TaxID=1117311 RepID=A0A9W4SQU7_9GLOM|nr:3104_t:CDS:2 [Funneliformis geosporum]